VCEISQCESGACVVAFERLTDADPVANCTPASPNNAYSDDCVVYQCTPGTSNCDPVLLPDGTVCSNGNLCDNTTCQGGVCTVLSTNPCNMPTMPCEAPIGTCNPSTGNCTYPAKPQYSTCTPTAAQIVASCPANVSGNYQCALPQPDSPCSPTCGQSSVCGDGIVSVGEQCDWAVLPYGDPCCTKNCTFKPAYTFCNGTPAVNLTAIAVNESSAIGVSLSCFPSVCLISNSTQKAQCTVYYNQTAHGCAVAKAASSTRKAIIGAVVAAGVLAAVVAAAAIFFWRRAAKVAEAEWLQEYLDAGNTRVENNPAFQDQYLTVNNPAAEI